MDYNRKLTRLITGLSWIGLKKNYQFYYELKMNMSYKWIITASQLDSSRFKSGYIEKKLPILVRIKNELNLPINFKY